MSTREPRDLTCLHCGHAHEVMVLKGMHITSLPEERAQLLAGTLHVFPCPACGGTNRVEVRTVYTDFDRCDYVAVEPVGTPLDASAQALHRQVYDQAFTFGPDIAQELGATFRHRLVAGLGSLREKVLAWDAGLDDRVLEATKGDVQQALALDPGAEEWRLAEVLAGNHLLFVRLQPAVPPAEGEQQVVVPERAVLGFHTVPYSVYARRLSDRAGIPGDYPNLRGDWVVDLLAG